MPATVLDDRNYTLANKIGTAFALIQLTVRWVRAGMQHFVPVAKFTERRDLSGPRWIGEASRRKMTQKWALKKEQGLEIKEWVGMEACDPLPADVLQRAEAEKGWGTPSRKTRTAWSTGLAGEVIFVLL